MQFEETWAPALLDLLEQLEHSSVGFAGKQLAIKNAVQSLSVDANGGLVGVVRQSRLVTWNAAARISGGIVSSNCSCRRNMCEHLYAVALLFAREGELRGSTVLRGMGAEFIRRPLKRPAVTASKGFYWPGESEEAPAPPASTSSRAEKPAEWWLQFTALESADARKKLLTRVVAKFLPTTISPWAQQNVVTDLLRLDNSIAILRKFNSALQAHLSYNYYRGTGTAGDDSAAFLAFLTSPKADEINAREERRIMQQRLLKWLAEPEHDARNASNLGKIDIIWLTVPTYAGVKLACFQLLLTTRKMIRRARTADQIRQLDNEASRGDRAFEESEKQLLQWVARRPELVGSGYGGARHAELDTETMPVRDILAWLTGWGGLGLVQWADGDKVVFNPKPARLTITESNGTTAWAIQFPHEADAPPRTILLQDADIIVEETAFEKADKHSRYYLRDGTALRPLEAGRMPFNVLAGLRKVPEFPTELLRFNEAGESLARRLQPTAQQRLAHDPLREEVAVDVVIELRLQQNNVLSLRAYATGRDERKTRFVRTHAHGWHQRTARELPPDPFEPLQELLAPKSDVAEEKQDEPAAAATGEPSAVAIALMPRLADIEPVEAWLEAIVPARARTVNSGDIPSTEWSAEGSALLELLRRWAIRPKGPSYLGNGAFRNLVNVREAPKFNVSIDNSGTDWLKVSVEMETEIESLSLAEIETALAVNDDNLVLLRGGRLYSREGLEEYRNKVGLLNALGLDLAPGQQRIHAMQLAGTSADAVASLGDLGNGLHKLAKESRRIIKQFAGIPAADVEPSTAAFLRPYQRQGVDFLALAAETFGGGVLADDMGLGKTLQILATITALRRNTRKPGPSLVTCPASVTHNWRREAERFAPHLRVAVIERGAARADILQNAAQYDLVIINHALTRRDIKLLITQQWLAVVVDEAQAIKNPEADVTRAVKKLQAKYRFALTGTPIENRLTDLWSIMDFAVPGYLGSIGHFSTRTQTADESAALMTLRARLRPVLIRRLKAEVAPELPERIEERMDCPMTEPQRKVYVSEVKKVRSMLKKLEGPKIAGQGRIQMLAAITRLRQLCCEPELVGFPGKGSGKVEELLSVVTELLAEGHKVLIFSQFVRMLNILKRELTPLHVPLYMLTGATTKRQELVEAFEKDKDPGIFLISLKAGGTGLNLTSASHVIIFDPWWNPAVEAQAIDRTHRIGQDKTVVAFRLVSSDTIEERILELQEQKRGIVKNLLEEESFNRTLSRQDFEYLLAEEPAEVLL